MTPDAVDNNESAGNIFKSNPFNILILVMSLLSLVVELSIGLTLIIQYYSHGYTYWAIITFSFIFFPAVIIQIHSIKLHLVKGNMMPLQWILHSLLLGVFHRYVKFMKQSLKNFKSKNCASQHVMNEEVINLKNLYLIQSFMASAPQLVFQFYVLVMTHKHLLLTGILASISVFSITWALILHTRIMKSMCLSLLFLIIWRVCMISARVTAFILCACSFGCWIILFIGSHWLAMTLWITYQKAIMDEKGKKGEFHPAFFGVIYCFCFFSLRNGQSKCKVIVHNFLLMFENLTFLTVFLMQFSQNSPRLAVASFIFVVFGNVVGISSLLVYNTFFRPNLPSYCESASTETPCCATLGFFNGNKFYVLTNKKRIQGNNDARVPKSESEELRNVQSESIVIYEENPVQDANCDENTVKEVNEKSEGIYEELSVEQEKNEEGKFSVAMKRRAICSSVDLRRFVDKKMDDSEVGSSRSSKEAIAYEAPSEILSAHDYENLCAVNIAREPWGIRSWRGYSDIETWGHDDSVFNERRLDNMTTSSEYSGKAEDKDYLNVAEDDLLHCEIGTNSDKTSINCLPPLPASMLDTIMEEREVSSNSIQDLEDVKLKCNSESTLVATIGKICLYTPMRGRSVCGDNEGIRHVPENKNADQIFMKRDTFWRTEKKEAFSPIKDKIRSMQKFNIFKEKYEINTYSVSNGSVPPNRVNGSNMEDEGNKENCVKEWEQRNKPRCENGRVKVSFKERGSFLAQVLTPSKLERRTFAISPPNR